MMASASSLSDVISIFPNARDNRPSGQASVYDVLKEIKDGKHSRQIQHLRQIKDPEEYRKEKCKLPAFTVACAVSPTRSKTNIKSTTGCIFGDIDHYPNVKELMKKALEDPLCHGGFISASNEGCKLLFRADGIETDEDNKRLFASLQNYIRTEYEIEIDPACKDISRLTFVSDDPDAFIKKDADLFPIDKWLPKPDPEPERKAGPSNSSYSDAGHDRRHAYGAKVLERACAEIASSVPGQQHKTRIRVAHKIGGFIASGFIDENVALDMLEDAVRRSGAKDMKASMKDITDGISKGKLKPIYPDLKQDDPGQYYEDTEQQGPPEDDYVPPGEERQAGGEQQKKSRFGFVHIGELKVKPIDWTVKTLIEDDSLVVVFGDPGTYKSFLAIAIACCVSSGTYFIGNPVKQGTVFYIAGEGQNGLARRFNAWGIRNGIDLKSLPLFVSTVPTGLCDDDQTSAVIDSIKGIAETNGPPALVVIDTLARNFGPGDENSTKDMNGFIAACDRIRCLYKSTVLLVHHTGHADKTRSRGAMSLKGGIDAEYRLDRDESGIIRLESTKMKEADKPFPMAFRPAVVELGEIDGEVVTSVVLDSTTYEPPVKKGKAGRGKNQVTALEVLKNLFGEREQNLLNGGFDPSTARVSVDDWHDECANQGILDRRKFYKVKESLLKQGVISIFHGFVELVG